MERSNKKKGLGKGLGALIRDADLLTRTLTLSPESAVMDSIRPIPVTLAIEQLTFWDGVTVPSASLIMSAIVVGMVVALVGIVSLVRSTVTYGLPLTLIWNLD